jgi:hypothetical protein
MKGERTQTKKTEDRNQKREENGRREAVRESKEQREQNTARGTEKRNSTDRPQLRLHLQEQRLHLQEQQTTGKSSLLSFAL